VIYLDNNATTPVAPEVLAGMLPWFAERFGNASSLHRLGQESADAVEAARGRLARLVGATAAEIVFNSGATEANNTAIRSAVRAQPDKRRLVTSAVEHPSVLEPLEALERDGYEIVRAPCLSSGRLDLEALLPTIDARCALVSILWANNETGVVNDVQAIGEVCRAQRVPFHVDGVQAAGKLPLRLAGLPIDTCSFSAHKLHGPKGVGALYLRRGHPFEPLLRGGGQEKERRAGTENVPAIVGFGLAAELAAKWLATDGPQRLTALRERLERGLAERCGDVHVHGQDAPRIPNTANVRFGGLSGEALVLLASEEGVALSTGSACASGRHAPSHVLLAMGLAPEEASASVRFSLARGTSEGEIERCLELLPPLVAQLRSLAPQGRG
jgi:cysteine desulfurase